MKTHLSCIPCIQRHIISTTAKVTKDEKIQEKILREAMASMLELDWQATPIDITNKIYTILRRITGIDDPYKELKHEYNLKSLDLVKDLQEVINNTANDEDKLEKATLAAIAGNIIDFGAAAEFDINKTLERIMTQKIKAKDYTLLQSKILQSDTLLYFADNAGEIVFDKFYLETMLNVRKRNFERIDFVVKGGPSINDAMMEDVMLIGLQNIPNINFLKLGNGEKGTGPDRDSQEVKDWITANDLVISKGQANYEGMSEIKGLFFLLIAKCSHIASLLKVKTSDIIIAYNH